MRGHAIEWLPVAGCRLLLLVPVPAVPVLLQLVVSEIIHLR